jgi:hypothetical protein
VKQQHGQSESSYLKVIHQVKDRMKKDERANPDSPTRPWHKQESLGRDEIENDETESPVAERKKDQLNHNYTTGEENDSSSLFQYPG